jgi:putative endonuclease
VTDRPSDRPHERTHARTRARRTDREGDPRRALAARGEQRAATYLAERGYRIVGRNVRAGGVELDLVAERAGLVVFVEVKTRSSRSRGAPEEAVDARKRARLVRAAAAWLHERRPGGRAPRRVRFDVVACEVCPDGGLALRHWEGAFEAGD